MSTRPQFTGERRHWAQNSALPDPSDLNLFQVHRFTGPPTDLSLEISMRQLLERHSTLRTSYRLDRNNQPVAEIHEYADLDLPLLTVDAADETEALAFAEKFRSEPFELTVPPLIRLSIIRIRAEEFWVALVVHHIVAEADSLRIIWHELIEATGALPCDDADPNPSYEDFVATELRYVGSPEHACDTAFWKGKVREISNGIPPAEIASSSTEDPGLQQIQIEPEQWDNLIGLARGAAATPFAVILTCLGRALCRLLGWRQVTIGISVSTRPPEGYGAVVGNFTNIVPVVVKSTGGPLHQQVEETMDAIVESSTHARVSVQEIFATADDSLKLPAVQPLTVTATTYAQHGQLVTKSGDSACAVPVPRGGSKVGLSIYLAVHADSAVVYVVGGTQKRVIALGPLADELREQLAETCPRNSHGVDHTLSKSEGR